MSFQNFRLGEVTPVHHLQQPIRMFFYFISTTICFFLFFFSLAAATSISTSKQPYGSGDSEDGYTLIFSNLDEFQAWRQAEEDRNCVEFVKVAPFILQYSTPITHCLLSGRHSW